MGLGQAAREVWSRLGGDEFHRSVSIQLAEREAVRRRVARVGQEISLSSQAIGQLTISGLSRHGQPELGNHLSLRAPMAWQDIQSQVEKYLSTIYHQQSPQPMYFSAVLTGAKCQSCGSQTHQKIVCWCKDETCKTC